MATAATQAEEPEQENPLTSGLERQPIRPTTLTIFGATGDLSKRKLLPALYNLAHEGALPERFNLIGASRRDMSDDEYRTLAKESIQGFSRRETDEKVLDALLDGVRYVSGSFDDPGLYEKLEAATGESDERAGIEFNRVYYLSTSPSFFAEIVKQLGDHGLDHHEGSDVRVVIEKPIGTNLREARELNAAVLDVLDEEQVFRIDHYLGKETVQNVLAFRFANGL
ncbi:MAG: glucose-6-phosphate dehydrogenase, partial [Thermoleophilaceae bacterium]|nr:glucose-6-phosphate dehydrogenase [Thermoleophilaceae bacterium]